MIWTKTWHFIMTRINKFPWSNTITMCFNFFCLKIKLLIFIFQQLIEPCQLIWYVYMWHYRCMLLHIFFRVWKTYWLFGDKVNNVYFTYIKPKRRIKNTHFKPKSKGFYSDWGELNFKQYSNVKITQLKFTSPFNS